MDYDTKDFYASICKTHFKTKKYRLHYKAWDWETIPVSMCEHIIKTTQLFRDNYEIASTINYNEVGFCFFRAIVLYLSDPEKYEIQVGSLGITPANSKNEEVWWEYGNGSRDYHDDGAKEKMMIEMMKKRCKEVGVAYSHEMGRMLVAKYKTMA